MAEREITLSREGLQKHQSSHEHELQALQETSHQQVLFFLLNSYRFVFFFSFLYYSAWKDSRTRKGTYQKNQASRTFAFGSWRYLIWHRKQTLRITGLKLRAPLRIFLKVIFNLHFSRDLDWLVSLFTMLFSPLQWKSRFKISRTVISEFNSRWLLSLKKKYQGNASAMSILNCWSARGKYELSETLNTKR